MILTIKATIQAHDLRLHRPHPTIRSIRLRNKTTTPSIITNPPKNGINAPRSSIDTAPNKPSAPTMISKTARMVTPRGRSPEGAA